MQKSKIECCTHVSNPVRGPAEMSWHPKELEAIEKCKKPAIIFVGSMYDIFGEWVPTAWIHWILDTVIKCPQHTFVFLTKNPARYQLFYFPTNCYLGYSDDGTKDKEQWVYLVGKRNAFVSLEPLIGETVNIHAGIIKQVILGAQTGQGAIKPSREVVEETIGAMDKAGISVFVKDNLYKIYPDLPIRRELIWER